MNSMGRSLSDVILYNPAREQSDITINRHLVLAPFHSENYGSGGQQLDRLYLECPTDLTDAIKASLLCFRLKRRIVVEHMDNINVWCIYPLEESPQRIRIRQVYSDDVIIAKDPRLERMGYRFITTLGVDDFEKLASFFQMEKFDLPLNESNEKEYTKMRYKIGVAEGSNEILHGFSFPLECNADYLNGLSFIKGMHSGDWITGRNFRKGVHRRLVPLAFDLHRNLDGVAPGSNLIRASDGQVIGEVRCRQGNLGLASVKVRELVKANKQMEVVEPLTKVRGFVQAPFWWRDDASYKPRLLDSVNVPDGRPASVMKTREM